MSHAPSAHGGRVALVATALLGTTSYAGLPDVVPDAGASKPVEFETVDGPLADARGEVILQELTGTA
jgi:hypothetical protein